MLALASTIDSRLLKSGVVMGEVSPISVEFFASEEEPAEDDGTMDSGTRRAQTAVPPPRRQRGGTGQLSIKVSVRGHFNRDLNVDFDYIVADSINRDSIEVRKRLVSYNDNCISQSQKVSVKGYTVEDFSEVHKNTGVERPRDRLSLREQQRLDSTLRNEQAFSTSCEKELVLPEYFESSLGKIKPLKVELGTYVVEETGISPLLVAVGVLLFGLFALCTGFFLWRRGRKVTEEEDYFEDTPSMQDPTNIDKSEQKLESYEEEVRQYESEMSSRKELLNGGKNIHKMTSLDDSTIPTIVSEHSFSRKERRLSDTISERKGRMAPRGHPYESQSARSFGGSRNAVPRVINMGPDGDSATERDSRSSRELFKMTVGARSDRSLFSGGGGIDSRSYCASQRSVGRRNTVSARDLNKIYEEGESPKSRNAIPKISDMDFEDSFADTRSSFSSRSHKSRNAIPKILNRDYEDSLENAPSSDSSSSSSSS